MSTLSLMNRTEPSHNVNLAPAGVQAPRGLRNGVVCGTALRLRAEADCSRVSA